MRFIHESTHFLQASNWVLCETSLMLGRVNGITHNIGGNDFMLIGAGVHM